MIFVTVGNATQTFMRLLSPVDSLSRNGFFSGELICVQKGHNKDFKPSHCQVMAFFPIDQFQQLMNVASLIISHGGCGTLLNAVRLGKVPVVMPRRKKYGEHVNDHQVQLVEALAEEGKVIPAYEPEDLVAAVRLARAIKGRAAPSVAPRMVDLVAGAINELARRKA